MTAATKRSVTIVGCGRWLRRDDQVGLLTAERLAALNIPDADVWITESPGTDIAAELEQTDLLIVIDSARSDEAHPPGTWQRIDYMATPERVRARCATSTHSLSVDVGLRFVVNAPRRAEEISVYAIAAGDVGQGESLTPVVDQASREVAAAIVEEVRALRVRLSEVEA